MKLTVRHWSQGVEGRSPKVKYTQDALSLIAYQTQLKVTFEVATPNKDRRNHGLLWRIVLGADYKFKESRRDISLSNAVAEQLPSVSSTMRSSQ